MKKMICVSIACAAIFLSCKKDDGDDVSPSIATSQPKEPITRADLYSENGYISGTIKGQTLNGIPFEKKFKHQLDLEMANYSKDEMGDYRIHLIKADKYGSVGSEDKQTEMFFILSKDLTTVLTLSQLRASIYVDSTANSITKFNIDRPSSSGNSMTVSNVTFDLTTGNLKANYSINTLVPQGLYLVKATIVGEIDTKLTNIHYREAN